MSNINISFNTNGITTAQVILVLREKADLGTIIYQQAFTANSQHNVTVMDLNPVMHQAEVWDTNDGTTLNALKGQCDIDAAQTSGSGSFSYIQFKVDSGTVTGTGITTAGVCPVDGDTQYVDTALDGLSYLVNKVGAGIMQWGSEIQMIAGGGFEYIDGQVFSGQDEYTIIVANSTVATSASASSSELTDVIEHTANATLTSTHRNKLNVFNFAGTTAVLTMETLVGVPNKTLYAFSTHRGSQVNGEIAFQSGEGCYFRGALKNKIYLGKNETIKMMVKGGVCYCVYYDGDYARVGEQKMSYVQSGQPNELPCDGLTLYSGTTYKRVYEWLTTVLAAGMKVTQTNYDLSTTQNDTTVYYNRGKWMVDTVAQTFRTPDLRGFYPKAAPSDQAAGEERGWQVGSHYHQAGTEPNPIATFQKGIAHSVRAWSATAGTTSETASTDLNAAAGTKNEVNNIVYYPVVII
jgi:hypothetical protein